MSDLQGFNANEVEPLGEFAAVPAGKYLAVITNTEMKPTKAKTGNFLEFTFEVIDGEFKGRKLWARLNLENPNATAVKIARSELSSICRAVGIAQPKDSCELHNLPLVIGVKQKTNDDGDVFNEIKSYAKKDTTNPAKPQQAQSSTPPWRRG